MNVRSVYFVFVFFRKHTFLSVLPDSRSEIRGIRSKNVRIPNVLGMHSLRMSNKHVLCHKYILYLYLYLYLYCLKYVVTGQPRARHQLQAYKVSR